MAYSSAITLCSGAKMYDHDPTWVSYISIGLALFTFLLVLWNYKGFRTIVAALMVVIGSYFIIDSELRTGDYDYYYLGVFGLMCGVWVNGSFGYFYRRYLKPAIDSSPIVANS